MSFIYIPLAFIASVILHELAHMIMLRKYGVTPKIELHGKFIGITGYHENLRFSEKGSVLQVGIIAGLIPILFIDPWWILLYAYLCNSDILTWLSLRDYYNRYGDLYLIDTYSLM